VSVQLTVPKAPLCRRSPAICGNRLRSSSQRGYWDALEPPFRLGTAYFLETTILNQGLYPALKALGLKQAGMHALRRGCNRRCELAGINPAVLRQQMGHASAAMTALYTGEIPLELVQAEFSSKIGNQIVVL